MFKYQLLIHLKGGGQLLSRSQEVWRFPRIAGGDRQHMHRHADRQTDIATYLL